MADYVSPDARRRIAIGLMAAQYDRATPEEGNVAQRHGLLPLANYDNGKTGLAFPGFIADPLESWGRLLRNGYTPGDTQGVEDAFNVAGAAMMGGLAAPKPRNVVGSAGGDLKGAALGAIPDTPGIRAYHGSPHDFDRFDLSKIGTGEGAQAYGHGLYFAEKEGVAKSYRNALSDSPEFNAYGLVQKHLGKSQAARDEGIRWYTRDAADARRDGRMDLAAMFDSAIDYLKNPSKPPPETPGRMYEVNIKASPDDFLDWDKPLSQQSEKVRELLSPELEQAQRLAQQRDAMRSRISGNSSASAVDEMELLQNSVRDPAIADRLKAGGVAGVRYLDQGSRAGGEGSRNFVVFDDKLIEILRKYGLLGMAGGAAAAEYGFGAPSRPASPQYIPGDA